jgi:hypothetical protein
VNGIDVDGYDIRAGGGVDLYLTPVFSVGAGLTVELLGLTRPGLRQSDLGGSPDSSVYAVDGSSLGAAVAGTVVLGLHF